MLHLLTLGAYAWENTTVSDKLQGNGGADIGCIFHCSKNVSSHRNWVEITLLGNPTDIMCSHKYDGQKTMIEFLNKLAQEGGSKHFEVQDKAIRAGAAWLCEYAMRYSPKAATMIGRQSQCIEEPIESDLQRRKREAKERAMKQMQEKMAKFAAVVEDAEHVDSGEISSPSSNAEEVSYTSEDKHYTSSPTEENMTSKTAEPLGTDNIQYPVNRLLQDRPQCIICNDDSNMPNEAFLQNDKPGKQAGPKILAFCGFVQSSVVLKGGSSNSSSNLVGTHVSLCGHAVHTSCCASHLKDLAHRESRLADRLEGGKRAEFKCPLCRRLSNCLIPFIDVGTDWINSSKNSFVKRIENKSRDKNDIDIDQHSLDGFLSNSKWWAIRNDKSIVWNGRCSFIPANSTSNNNEVDMNTLLQKKQRKTFGKKDLYKAWSSVMSRPSFVRRGESSLSDNSDHWRAAAQSENSSSSVITEVWRRLMDQIADVSYKADVKRLGEERLFLDLGEFRHYMVEKVVFNEQNRSVGIEPSLVSFHFLKFSPSYHFHEMFLISLVHFLNFF